MTQKERDELRRLCKAAEEKPGEWVVNVPYKLVPVPLEKAVKLLDALDEAERKLAEAEQDIDLMHRDRERARSGPGW